MCGIAEADKDGGEQVLTQRTFAMKPFAAAMSLALLAACGVAQAASDDAWTAFRAEVEDCLSPRIAAADG